MHSALLPVLALLSISLGVVLNNVETVESAPGPIDFVKDIDFPRFMGIWYNIASLPNIIESNCKCPQSKDTLESELYIGLQESCLIFGRNVTSKSKALATVPGYGNWTNWNGPISAPYWILNLDKDYQWVVIGQPTRKGFWIMSRKPVMEKALLDELINWGKDHEFNLTKLEYADQSCFTKASDISVEI